MKIYPTKIGTLLVDEEGLTVDKFKPPSLVRGLSQRMKRIILPIAISNEIGLRPLTFDILSIVYCSTAPRPIIALHCRERDRRMIGALWAFGSSADSEESKSAVAFMRIFSRRVARVRQKQHRSSSQSEIELSQN